VATVFQLADKYHMEELKSAMEKRLVENLSTANVVEMAALADAYSAQGLRLRFRCASSSLLGRSQ